MARDPMLEATIEDMETGQAILTEIAARRREKIKELEAENVKLREALGHLVQFVRECCDVPKMYDDRKVGCLYQSDKALSVENS